MPKATAPDESSTPEEVPHARPDHRDVRRQRVGVDHGRHGIGRVVEAVDELESQRDQQCNGEKKICHARCDMALREIA